MSLNGVTFEYDDPNYLTVVRKHSYTDWGLILKKRPVIDPPEPKTVYIDIPSSDGSLDMTESLTGFVAYKDRKITMEFNVISARSGWSSLYTTIMGFVHGKKLRIVFDEDPNYYYQGRVEVDSWKSDKRTSTIIITAKVDPYKYKQTLTVESDTIDSDTIMEYAIGSKQPVIPIINVDHDCTITYGDKTYNLTAGDNRILEIRFKNGICGIEYHFDGVLYTATLTFREGDF